MRLHLGYDNLDDAQIKLKNTYVMYKGKAVHITMVLPSEDPEAGQYQLHGKWLASGRECPIIGIDDPDLSFDFNIGYINRYDHAAWFYRVPLKQWQQGLKHSQTSYRMSGRSHRISGLADCFRGKQLADMLENRYPKVVDCTKLLKEQEANILAFHRNFALTLNAVHGDFFVEYKGATVGHTPDGVTFTLMPEFEWLNESLKEAAA